MPGFRAGCKTCLRWIVETLYGLAEGILGKTRARQVFWLGATIFLFVLFANWMELVALAWTASASLEHPREPGIAHSRSKTARDRCW